MALLTHEKILSEEEFINFELKSDIKHEYINGKLIDMPRESDLHNQLVLSCCFLLKSLLKDRGYSFFAEGVKVKLPEQAKYFYPDVFITREPVSKGTIYVKEHPELIIEVLSDSTRKYDTVDKFINYQQFDTLQYYILIEPETVFISVFSRIEDNDWNLATYSKSDDVISLSLLDITFKVGEIYAL